MISTHPFPHRNPIAYVAIVSLLAASAAPAEWQQARLTSFGDAKKSALYPESSVILGTDGVLYGTTVEGGPAEAGAIFSVNQDGSRFQVLHSFEHYPTDGAYSRAALLEASDGVLYGTTDDGGNQRGGTIFRLNRDGTGYEVLHHFTAKNSAYGIGANAELIEGSDGMLYGTSQRGGANGTGSVFRINKNGSRFETLHDFAPYLSGGAYPHAALLEGGDGFLYGSTTTATLFKLRKDGTGFQVLHEFDPGWMGEPTLPSALIEGRDDALYGTTRGSPVQSGMVFRVTKGGEEFRKLHEFAPSGLPAGALLRGTNGWLYGLTAVGGKGQRGTLFAIHEAGNLFITLHSLGKREGDGVFPVGCLAKSSDGTMFGMTRWGGRTGMGTIFNFSLRRGWRTVWNFKKSGGAASIPNSALVPGLDGMLYGTTKRGGASENGVVFKIAPDGAGYENVWSFIVPRLGLHPNGVIVDPASGTLYGTTLTGGAHGRGTVFKLTGKRNYRVLHHFREDPKDGANPAAGLLLANDGYLYGTTSGGGIEDSGTIFRIKRDGSGFSLVHQFVNDGNGFRPEMTLIEGGDGALYAGVRDHSGLFEFGLIFKINKNGTGFTVLKRFYDGGSPIPGTLFLASDGKLYGTMLGFAQPTLQSIISWPNFDSKNVLFRISQDGTSFEVLHTFDIEDGPVLAPLAEGTDGALYGATQPGAHAGSVFRVNKDGSGFQRIHQFTLQQNDQGATPAAGLLLGPDGTLYGTTSAGGHLNQGTVFKLTPSGS